MKGRQESDIVLAQIDPRAREILGLVGFEIAPGFRCDRKGIERFSWGPNFTGVPENVWEVLLARKPALFWELVGICERDFPTWAALMAKIASKDNTGEPMPFIFNTPQRVAWGAIVYCLENDLPLWLIFLKARQFGITSFIALWQYWQEWRKPNTHSLFLGDRVDLLKRQLDMIRTVHDNMPRIGGIRPTLRSDTKQQTGKVPKYELFMAARGNKAWNSGGMTAPATKQNVALGQSCVHITCSEAAFWGGTGDILQDILDALTPQLPGESSPNYLGGASSLMVESTPQGMNDFRDLYWDAKEQTLDVTWTTVFLPWFIFEEGYFAPVPDDWQMSEEDLNEWAILNGLRAKYDGKPVTLEQMYWRYKMIRDKYKSAEVFNEWYPRDDETCFRAADGSVFKDDATYLEGCVLAANADAKKLLKAAGLPHNAQPLVGDLIFNPMPAPFYFESKVLTNLEAAASTFEPNPKGKISIWEPPQAGHIYVVGSDTSGGTGNDGACSHVGCVTCGAQAAEVWSRYLDPTNFCDTSVHLGWWYNNALIDPEVNHLGAAFLKRMIFDWNYPMVARDEAWDEARFKERKFGFSTGEHTKPVAIAYMVNLIKARHYRIASPRLRREMSRFYYLGLTSRMEERYAGGRTGKGADDTVLAMMLALWAVRQCPPQARADFEMRFTRIPTATELGLNRTSPGDGLFLGKSLGFDQYGPTDLDPRLENMFEDGLDQQLVPSCPMGSWQGYGLEL